jgi:hypothetical protein
MLFLIGPRLVPSETVGAVVPPGEPVLPSGSLIDVGETTSVGELICQGKYMLRPDCVQCESGRGSRENDRPAVLS